MLDISHHKPGQLVVFTGSAGSGKTLILCLTALLSIQKDDDYVLFITSEEPA